MDNYNNYLIHHGVKGMKWGVRKSLETEGYRRGSLYTQKRNIRQLKSKKRAGTVSSEQYKRQKAQIKHRAAVERGKRLVENNQSYGRVAVKGIAKTAAVGLGTAAVAGLAAGSGGTMLVPMAVAGGAGMAFYSGRNDISRMKDIRAYRHR